MDLKGRNAGNWDNMSEIAHCESELARNKKNDVESELTTNHFNRIFHNLKSKIIGFFKKHF